MSVFEEDASNYAPSPPSPLDDPPTIWTLLPRLCIASLGMDDRLYSDSHTIYQSLVSRRDTWEAPSGMEARTPRGKFEFGPHLYETVNDDLLFLVRIVHRLAIQKQTESEHHEEMC